MKVKSLRVQNFRNYTLEKIIFDKDIIIFNGQNGQGKTNLLEALYMASISRSHRNSVDTELIKWGCDKASILVESEINNTKHLIKIIMSDFERKKVFLNDTKISQKELFGTLKVVLFSPEDLQIIKGSPTLRRKFLDIEISQVKPTYYYSLLKYNKLILQKNALLKENKRNNNKGNYEEWDLQIAKEAAKIVKERKDSLVKINEIIKEFHYSLSNNKEELIIKYEQPYFDSNKDKAEDIFKEEWYYQKLKDNREKDFYRQTTSIGPHRDDILFFINDNDLKKFGSQGQQRTAILSLKLAEIEFIKNETEHYPILLLDDVMSELDENRQKSLLQFIKGKMQTFITTTELNHFTENEKTIIFTIENGKVIDNGKSRQ